MSKNIVLFVQDPDEKQVLQIMLESYGYTVLPLAMEESSFREIIQYDPAHIIFELPEQNDAHLTFIQRIRSNNKTFRIPILAYGDLTSGLDRSEIARKGISAFIERPLTTDSIQLHIKSRRQGTKTLHSKEVQVYEGELEDTAKIMSTETSTTERIEIMVKRIGELLAFPFTVAKVLSVTQSETSGAQDLARAIELDPVVVTSVLKVANSAYYRGTSSTMGVKDAIVRIGFTETKGIAIAMSVMKLFSDEEKSVGFSREDFWFHSLATAIIAGEIAKIVRYPKPEVAFIGGLMHDFGIILLDEFFPSFLNTTLHETIKTGQSFTAVQYRKWKMTHHDVVARLFRDWSMPEELIELIKNCFRYEAYDNKNDEEANKLVHAVGIAEVMAKSLSLGRECDEFVSFIPNEILDRYKIMNQLGDRFWSKIAKDLNMFSSFLNLKKDTVEFNRNLPDDQILHTVVLTDISKQLINPFEFHLISQNNKVIRGKEVESVKEMDPSPELIVLATSEDDGYETIAPWISIPIQKSYEAVGENAKQEMIPVLLINDHNLRGDSFEIPEHVVIVPSSIDLRVFSFALESLILGHPFTMNYQETKPKEVFHESDNSTEEKSEPVPFSFKTRVISKVIAIVELRGSIVNDVVKELSQIISVLFKKTKFISIDFTHATEIDETVLLLLNNFRKALRSKGGLVTLFTSDSAVKERLSTDSQSLLYHFSDDSALTELIKNSLQVLKQENSSHE